MKPLALIPVIAVIGGLGLFALSIPHHDHIEIPDISTVPIPDPRPGRASYKLDMCPRYVPKQHRIPGTNLVFEKYVASGAVPCNTLEPGSLSWIMNGKNI
jgi:hypothetical protein